jgi:hypothetical protein
VSVRFQKENRIKWMKHHRSTDTNKQTPLFGFGLSFASSLSACSVCRLDHLESFSFRRLHCSLTFNLLFISSVRIFIWTDDKDCWTRQEDTRCLGRKVYWGVGR